MQKFKMMHTSFIHESLSSAVCRIKIRSKRNKTPLSHSMIWINFAQLHKLEVDRELW